MFGRKTKELMHEPDVTRGRYRFRRVRGDRVTVSWSNPAEHPYSPEDIATVRDDRPLDRVADDHADDA
ncbi:hypothetical protein FsymDg_4371 [Candidatus Protofrankia datiscae]|uniref:Uncharacterized protein n=1 Tax=Candidatus Protofrankia datiscae TaxID=2716812 RepID=F8AZ95_9ACTN|nr:hypothetical protein [Candidatus Protofrankia datiscae]AEH11624.1 hypothetical protein FsymDg_4371 [Candidatus Protofrankia datiscae]